MKMRQIPLMTQLKWILLRYQFILLSIGFMIVGGGLVYLATATFTVSIGQSIAKDVGLALFTAGLIGLALEFYTRRRFLDVVTDSIVNSLMSSPLNSKLDSLQEIARLGEDLKALGIKKIYLNRHNIDLMQYLAEADLGTEIRLLGVCLMGFTYAPMQVAIENKLKDECKVRFLILDPNSQFVKQRAIEENRDFLDIGSDIAAADQMHSNFIIHRLAPELRGRIELRHYDSAPAYFILSTSRVMIVGFYLRDKRGEFFPHLELDIKGGGIYLPFLNHFDSLWEASRSTSSVVKDEDSAA